MDTQWCLTCNRHLVRFSSPLLTFPSPSLHVDPSVVRLGELGSSVLLLGVLQRRQSMHNPILYL